MGKTQTDPRITKRKVTLTRAIGKVDPHGKAYVETHVMEDYVLPEHLEAYVADALTRWDHAAVGDEPDAGPGGYDGQTHIPATLEHPEAGTTRPATTPED